MTFKTDFDFHDWIFFIGGLLLVVLGLFDGWANTFSGTTVLGLLMILSIIIRDLVKKQTDK